MTANDEVLDPKKGNDQTDLGCRQSFQTNHTQILVLARPSTFWPPLARPNKFRPPLARVKRLCPHHWPDQTDRIMFVWSDRTDQKWVLARLNRPQMGIGQTEQTKIVNGQTKGVTKF